MKLIKKSFPVAITILLSQGGLMALYIGILSFFISGFVVIFFAWVLSVFTLAIIGELVEDKTISLSFND